MAPFSVDKKKFEETYLNYYPKLMVYGKTMTKDEALIEDVIQELFLNLWQKKDMLLIRSSLDAYLYRSLRNNLIRKLKIKTHHTLVAEPGTVESTAADQEKEEALEVLLDQLPPSQKEVLFLRYYQGRSYQEIAEILGIKYQVARNFAYRAIKFLKKNMKHLSSIVLSLSF